MATPSASASPSPGPSAEVAQIAANRHAPTAVELQRMQLAKLLKDPAKPVHIPAPPKEKTIRPAREMMKNVQGSSAGAGSGEFHVYKASRRREYERLKAMDETSQKEAAIHEFEMKKRQWETEADAKTAKNRAKRQKKKEKSKTKGGPAGASAAGGKGDAGGSDAAQTSRDVPLKKRRLVNGEVMVFKKPGDEEDESEEDEPGPIPSDMGQSTLQPGPAPVEDQPREVAETAKIVIHEED